MSHNSAVANQIATMQCPPTLPKKRKLDDVGMNRWFWGSLVAEIIFHGTVWIVSIILEDVAVFITSYGLHWTVYNAEIKPVLGV